MYDYEISQKPLHPRQRRLWQLFLFFIPKGIKQNAFSFKSGCLRPALSLQLWPLAYAWLLSKPYENEGILRGQNIPLKYYHSIKLLIYI